MLDENNSVSKNPAKMCIKSAPYLHQKSGNQASNKRILCFGADVTH